MRLPARCPSIAPCARRSSSDNELLPRRKAARCWTVETSALSSRPMPTSSCSSPPASPRAHSAVLPKCAATDAMSLWRTSLRDIAARDARDMNREDAPLKPASDAYIFDTTSFDKDAAIDAAIEVGRGSSAELNAFLLWPWSASPAENGAQNPPDTSQVCASAHQIAVELFLPLDRVPCVPSCRMPPRKKLAFRAPFA